jgi:AcrR family transcriptional regulator
MTDTEKEILDAALKVFAKKGYDAATTRAIAEESGFTEMTLFRKFQTKQNLFDQVLNRGNEEIQSISADLFGQKEYKSTRDFLKALVFDLDEFMQNNFEFFHLSVIENSNTVDSILDLIVNDTGEYLKKQFPQKKLNYKTYGFSISTYIYTLNIDRYYGRTASYGNYQESLNNLVDILHCMIEN